jgi:hypothetical protein
LKLATEHHYSSLVDVLDRCNKSNTGLIIVVTDELIKRVKDELRVEDGGLNIGIVSSTELEQKVVSLLGRKGEELSSRV